MRHPVLILFSLFAFCIQARAEEGIGKTFVNDFISPFTTPAFSVFAKGTILTGVISIFEDQIDDPTQAEVTEDKPLGATSKWGDILGQNVPNALFIIGAATSGYINDDTSSWARANHMFRATLHAGIMAQLLKVTVREPRPSDRSDRSSFPSGHTTTAFAFASVIGADYGWGWGVPSYMLATFVGYSRMNDNRHYLHDVLGGATIGIGYGLGVYYHMIYQTESPIKHSGARLEDVYIARNEEGGSSLWAQISY